jgi:hypothetical protein
MSDIIGLLVLCLFALATVAWAHLRLSSHSKGTRLLVRTVLIVIAAAFGWTMAFVYTDGRGLIQLLIFISAFGFVHLPAACVLQLKHWRGIPRQEQ